MSASLTQGAAPRRVVHLDEFTPAPGKDLKAFRDMLETPELRLVTPCRDRLMTPEELADMNRRSKAVLGEFKKFYGGTHVANQRRFNDYMGACAERDDPEHYRAASADVSDSELEPGRPQSIERQVDLDRFRADLEACVADQDPGTARNLEPGRTLLAEYGTSSRLEIFAAELLLRCREKILALLS